MYCVLCLCMVRTVDVARLCVVFAGAALIPTTDLSSSSFSIQVA